MTKAELLQLRLNGTITDQQHDVLLLRSRGLSHKTISLALGLSRTRIRSIEQAGQLAIARSPRKDAA